jgi:hypothetical protein
MVLCRERVATFVGASTRDEFLANVLVYDAVLRNLEILGEAAKHVPAEVKAQMPDVAWREIAGSRGTGSARSNEGRTSPSCSTRRPRSRPPPIVIELRS